MGKLYFVVLGAMGTFISCLKIALCAVTLGLWGLLGPAAASGLPAVDAAALPSGAKVVAGKAVIQQVDKTMVIQQSSNKLITNWKTFDVGRDATVRFEQPGRSSTALNRVQSMDPSQIHGRIQANGQVFLVNPNGVVFGNGAVIDAGSLLVSTRDIGDNDFLNDVYSFEGQSAGVIDQLGQVRTADGGFVVLIAPHIRQAGQVTVPARGSVAMLAANKVRLQIAGNDLVGYLIDEGAVAAQIDHTGTTLAEGGKVVLDAQAFDALTTSVVNQHGVIRADSLVAEGGKVVLRADKVNLSEKSITSATGVTKGGDVQIIAKDAEVSGQLDVSSQYDAGRAAVWAEHALRLNKASLRAVSNEANGGEVQLAARETIEINDSILEANAEEQGGQVHIQVESNLPVPHVQMESTPSTGLLDPAHPLNQPTSPPSAPSRLAILGASTLNAGSRRGQGGGMVLTADEISLLDTTQLSATGATGGGFVLVGGDWQGGANEARSVFDDPDAIYEATRVFMDADVVIDASATDNGDGGTVVLWSDISNPNSVTEARGSIFAKGGAQSGDGGYVETSGKWLDLGDNVNVSTRAPAGQDGLWLLDPEHLWIITPDWTGFNYSTTGTTTFTAQPANPSAAPIDSGVETRSRGPTVDGVSYAGVSTLKTSTIVSALNSGNVRVLATGLIEVMQWQSSNISNYYINSTTTNTLTLEAGTSIYLGSPAGNRVINMPNGKLELLAGASITQLSDPGGSINVGTLTLGKCNSCSTNPTVTLDNASNQVSNIQASNVSSLSVYSNANLTVNTLGVDGDVLLKASGNISLAASKSVITNGGDITLWSDTDSNGGYIKLESNAILDSRSNADRSASRVSNTSGGGSITLGGGADPLTGYASGAADASMTNGVWLQSGTTLYSGGGNVSLRGQSSNVGLATLNVGVYLETSTLDAGSGTILVNGVGRGSGSANAQGVNMSLTTRITSSSTQADAIQVLGNTASASGGSSLAVNIGGTTIAATGVGGGILINGVGGTGSAYDHGIDLGDVSLLAASGPIRVIADNPTFSSNNNAHLNFWGGVVFGSLAGSSVTSSTSDITLRADSFTVAGSNQFRSSGQVSIEPLSNSFASTQTFASGFDFGSSLTGLTIGKSTNTANITLGSAITIAGPITVYGGAVTLNANLTTTNTSTGDVSITTSGLTGSGGIALASGRALTVTQSGDSVYSGVISGTDAALIKAGDGRLTLTGSHMFTGITTISSGTLRLGDGGSATGSLSSSQMVNNGHLVIDSNQDQVLAYDVTGSGTMEVVGRSRDFFNSYVTTSSQLMASNTSVAELIARVAGVTNGGGRIWRGNAWWGLSR